MDANPHSDAATAAVDRLSAALDAVGDALVAVDADAMLQREGALGAAMSALDDLRGSSDRDATIAACRRARVALLRCRRLGMSFASLSRAFTTAVSTDAYDRGGAYVDPRGAAAGLRAMA